MLAQDGDFYGGWITGEIEGSFLQGRSRYAGLVSTSLDRQTAGLTARTRLCVFRSFCGIAALAGNENKLADKARDSWVRNIVVIVD